MVVARTDGFDPARAGQLYDVLFPSEVSAGLEDLVSRLSDTLFPEVSDGMRGLAAAYIPEGGSSISRSDFVLMHSDMFACSPTAYDGLLDGLWVASVPISRTR